jgi:hypothetical protein
MLILLIQKYCYCRQSFSELLSECQPSSRAVFENFEVDIFPDAAAKEIHAMCSFGLFQIPEYGYPNS